MPGHSRLQVQSVFDLDSCGGGGGISEHSITVPMVCFNNNGYLKKDKLCVTSVESVFSQDFEFIVHSTFTLVADSGVRFILCID